mmetsp:Transcript_6834/g.19279  ORF Transcript_6834/g.19279 Transcript_6834/m.19279 type:complete len:226 (-) Transcript_6834:2776-3453(-)
MAVPPHLLHDLHQHAVHILGHVPGVTAHVDVAARLQHVPHRRPVLPQLVLHVNLLGAGPGEGHRQEFQGAVHCGRPQLTLVQEVCLATAAEEQGGGGLPGTGGQLLQEAAEGGKAGARAHHDHRGLGVGRQAEAVVAGHEDVHRHAGQQAVQQARGEAGVSAAVGLGAAFHEADGDSGDARAVRAVGGRGDRVVALLDRRQQWQHLFQAEPPRQAWEGLQQLRQP